MTRKQIEWAQSHDWYVCLHGNDGVICDDGIDQVIFHDIKKLREWAGY